MEESAVLRNAVRETEAFAKMARGAIFVTIAVIAYEVWTNYWDQLYDAVVPDRWKRKPQHEAEPLLPPVVAKPYVDPVPLPYPTAVGYATGFDLAKALAARPLASPPAAGGWPAPSVKTGNSLYEQIPVPTPSRPLIWKLDMTIVDFTPTPTR
jgi:hypothetical protein